MDDLQEIEIRLWDYIDGNSDSAEKEAIEQLIAENILWREKYAELLEIHQLISKTEVEQPSLRFTKNVMDEINKLQIAPATKSYINKNIIRSIAAFFMITITGILLYAFSQIDWTDNKPASIGVDFSGVDYSNYFNSTYINIFMMLNVVLGLMLLDRYLNNKKKKLGGSVQ